MTSLLEFHAFLLSNTGTRLDRFAKALAATIRPGDTVVDLGAGSGILSILACRAGARRAYAIEDTDAVSIARALVATTPYRDRIEIIHARVVRSHAARAGRRARVRRPLDVRPSGAGALGRARRPRPAPEAGGPSRAGIDAAVRRAGRGVRPLRQQGGRVASRGARREPGAGARSGRQHAASQRGCRPSSSWHRPSRSAGSTSRTRPACISEVASSSGQPEPARSTGCAAASSRRSPIVSRSATSPAIREPATSPTRSCRSTRP